MQTQEMYTLVIYRKINVMVKVGSMIIKNKRYMKETGQTIKSMVKEP
jgi:hypothetical protein